MVSSVACYTRRRSVLRRNDFWMIVNICSIKYLNHNSIQFLPFVINVIKIFSLNRSGMRAKTEYKALC